ncbi:glycosyltransferase [Amaricoccus sp.]|uniref:glycosyltransferase n=1 Tax=Amaricoccus sp. TaxID=1872485 RepID=UPI002619F9B7|nr:glycosyltransferase [uncultured Amaricoccus sp.]
MSISEKPTELLLLPSLRAKLGPNGGLVLTRKYMNGAAEYAKYWPGPVTTLAYLDDHLSDDMDHAEYMPGAAETGLEIRPIDPEEQAARLARGAVALAFLSPTEAETARICQRIGLPLVFTSEYSPRTERQIIDAEVANPVRRWRRKLWAAGAERSRQASLRIAAGLQCSGVPTFDLYRPLQPESLLFFDNRVPEADIISEEALAAKALSVMEGRPLRLIFGGRLIAMKGVREIPKVARELVKLGVPFTFEVYGSGALEQELRDEIAHQDLGDKVRLGGVLDFQTAWIPLLKREVDIFVCCHPQGDPSCTYPEVMSCGVPIAGYDNEAFVGVVKHSGGGWLSPMNDPVALANQLAELYRDRGQIVEVARRARDFALRHTFEATFARRTAHLRSYIRDAAAAE